MIDGRAFGAMRLALVFDVARRVLELGHGQAQQQGALRERGRQVRAGDVSARRSAKRARCVRRAGTLAAAAVLTVCLARVAGAATPTEELRRQTDQVLAILRAPNLSPGERRTAVRNVALNTFDITETARRALGTHWQQRTSAERDEFVQLFRELLEQTYVSRIDEYGGERLEYLAERVDGDSAVVRAQILTSKGLAVPVESRLSLKSGRWLVYDVLIENVSLVGNYRSQFDRIIRTSSYGELVKRLRDRVAALAEGAGKATPPSRGTPR